MADKITQIKVQEFGKKCEVARSFESSVQQAKRENASYSGETIERAVDEALAWARLSSSDFA